VIFIVSLYHHLENCISMKIASWNVNSVRSRQQHLLDWLTQNPVDVLCLQETKVVDEHFPRKPFEDAGYHLYISGQKSYNGVALLSREPLKDVSAGFEAIVGKELTDNLDEQKRVITGVINDIRIINLYVPNGSSVGSEKYDYKLGWLKVLKTYLETLRTSATPEFCVCGDFNIALEAIDIYSDKVKETDIMASPAERTALQAILAMGLKDAFRKFTLEGGHYSWWDYRTGAFRHNRGWRIDHHYLTPQLYEKAVSCTIDTEPRAWEKPSDHAPVIVEL
jgi:exodeoxyribonuclease-3